MATSHPIKVGVDGSKASIRAALWAADEAAARHTTLDLVCVVDPSRCDDPDDALATARQAIHCAWEAVEARHDDIELESEILQGDPVIELANAARQATLLCVGHKGVDDSDPSPRGATAEALIRMAPTSVAVVRRRHSRPPTFHRWIVAILDESPESHVVLQTALDEAAMREAPVLALTTWSTALLPETPSKVKGSSLRAKMNRYVTDTLDDTADIRVCALPMPHDVTAVLEQSAGIDQLFVVGASRKDVIAQLTDEKASEALRGTNCSIMVVRADTDPVTASAGREDSASVA
jgi:nucleotide-binding universal stress UspA family protein